MTAAVTVSHVQQRPYVMHGEISGDGNQVVLVAGADNPAAMTYVAGLLTLLTPLVKPADPSGLALTLPLSWAATVQLAITFGSSWKPGPRLTAWIAAEVQRRVAEQTGGLAVPVPAGLTPRSYQVAGALMIKAVGSCLITDEPGTGKTITTILGLRERGVFGPVLVICPASVVDPWVKAWHAWAPDLSTIALRGTGRRKWLGSADVYVTSYDTARVDAGTSTKPGPLAKFAWSAAVLDECHLIKSQDSARSRAARRVAKRADTVVALSGTPITHNSADLWPTLNAIDMRAWPSRERYVDRYCLSIPGDYSDKVISLHPDREPEFRTAILGQHRRVAKADVLDELPPKIYTPRHVELPPEYRQAYDEMAEDMIASLPDGGELPVMSVLAQLQRLSQLASSAADVDVTVKVVQNEFGEDEERPHYTVTLKLPSWKVDALLEILDERPDQRVVCFAPSRQLVMLAGQAAEKTGRRVGYIVGGQTPKQRTGYVDAFQAGELDLICVTTQAGGVGITLTAASTGVFLQRPWSLVDAIQAEDRLHRIGSEIHDSIEIIDVIAVNTIDEQIRVALLEKGQQLADLVQDPRIVAELLGGKQATKTGKKAS